MIDFLTSTQGIMMMITFGILGAVGFIIFSVMEAVMYDEFDPVCEHKCKKCICYDMCRHHGCIYDCPDYMTEEQLQERGMKP